MVHVKQQSLPGSAVVESHEGNGCTSRTKQQASHMQISDTQYFVRKIYDDDITVYDDDITGARPGGNWCLSFCKLVANISSMCLNLEAAVSSGLGVRNKLAL